MEWVGEGNFGFMRSTTPIQLYFFDENRTPIAHEEWVSLWVDEAFIFWMVNRALYVKGNADLKPVGPGRFEQEVRFRPPEGARYFRYQLGAAKLFTQVVPLPD
jgi:hypothetical protein